MKRKSDVNIDIKNNKKLKITNGYIVDQDCLNIIFSNINPKDLIKLLIVCKSWNIIISNHIIWTASCEQKILNKALSERKNDYKLLFLKYICHKCFNKKSVLNNKLCKDCLLLKCLRNFATLSEAKDN